jgi:hypothetical protein
MKMKKLILCSIIGFATAHGAHSTETDTSRLCNASAQTVAEECAPSTEEHSLNLTPEEQKPVDPHLQKIDTVMYSCVDFCNWPFFTCNPQFRDAALVIGITILCSGQLYKLSYKVYKHYSKPSEPIREHDAQSSCL